MQRRSPCTLMLLILGLGVLACGTDAAPTQIAAESSLTGAVLARNAAFGRLDRLTVSGPYLWVIDASGEPFIHLVNRESGEVLLSAGRRGEGPGEFAGIDRLFPSQADPATVQLGDTELHRLTDARIDSSGTLQYGSVTSLPIEGGFLTAAFRGGYIGWLPSPGSRWALFGPDRMSPVLVDGPLVGPDAADFRQRVSASVNLKICVKPDQSRFAVLYGSAGRIELHDSAAAFLGLAHVPDSTNGEFVVDPGGRLRWDRQRYYYGSCAATERFLFALFSGRSEGTPDEVTNASDRLQVFNWDGELQDEFRLSTRIVRIAINSAATTLYGSGAEGNVIYRFDIPAEFQGARP